MTASDAERKLSELSFLHEVAQLASSARDWDEMLRIVIERTTDAMGAEVSSLYLLERSDNLLRLVATNGLNRGGIGRATLRLGEGIGIVVDLDDETVVGEELRDLIRAALNDRAGKELDEVGYRQSFRNHFEYG